MSQTFTNFATYRMLDNTYSPKKDITNEIVSFLHKYINLSSW